MSSGWMGQFEQCKTKVKEQNKGVMDFEGENKGETGHLGCGGFRSAEKHYQAANYFGVF